MRLMGNSRLFELAERGDGDMRAAVRALHAELRAAKWRSAQDVLNSYPSAAVAGNRFTIFLDETHCVVVAVSYSLGFVLTEFAGDQRHLKRKHLAISEKQI
jgi:hypothetical protein